MKNSKLQNLLECIRGLSLLANQDKIGKIKKNTIHLDSGDEKMCNLYQDGMPNEDLAKQIKKDVPHVIDIISNLQQKRLITIIEKNSKKIYEQRF